MNAPTETFRRWACSLSGCDGGNPSADIWLCGIEWGEAGDRLGAYYSTGLPGEIAAGAFTPVGNRYDWARECRGPFGRGVAKLYAAIRGQPVDAYRELASNQWDGSELFKLNLYPIAFDSTDSELWIKNGLESLTGFSQKNIYQTWCAFNRFPTFAQLRERHKPRLIIGVGVSYLRDFLSAFGGDLACAATVESALLPPEARSEKEGRRYYWSRLNERTTLVVLPFFTGRFGLNSNELLRLAGERIASLQPSLRSDAAPPADRGP